MLWVSVGSGDRRLEVKSECNPGETDSFSPQTTPLLWKLEGFGAMVTSVEGGLGVLQGMGSRNLVTYNGMFCTSAYRRTDVLGRTE